jgi:hypothetical protein
VEISTELPLRFTSAAALASRLTANIERSSMNLCCGEYSMRMRLGVMTVKRASPAVMGFARAACARAVNSSSRVERTRNRKRARTLWGGLTRPRV